MFGKAFLAEKFMLFVKHIITFKLGWKIFKVTI